MTFSRATQAWLDASFEAPTPAQRDAWKAIEQDHHTLVVAPTGSGKTLAAFLWAIDQHMRADADPAPQILYISPLKALASDVERNLRAPLVGIGHQATRLGLPMPDITVGVRTGDTSARDRARMTSGPPDIIITTPESLFLMLTSGAQVALARVGTVIVDEIHALAGTKRGAHLALSLERLDVLLDKPAQRVGLSATVTPTDRVADFLAGRRLPTEGGRAVRVVQPPATKRIEIDLEAVEPSVRHLRDDVAAGDDLVEDLTGDAAGGSYAGGSAESNNYVPGFDTPAAAGSTWPEVERRIVDLIAKHRSTLVFVNARRTAEKLTARLNEEWARRTGLTNALGETALTGTSQWPAAITAQAGAALGIEPVIARAHHGSMSRTERTTIESALKSGQLPAVVATSSLELGIDMGAIDLVIQVGAPPSVASGLQRIGRAGHQVGEVSRGVMLTLHRGELVPAAVTAIRMRERMIEAVHDLTNPLDVLAQQVVAAVAMGDWHTDELLALMRRATPFATLGAATWSAVLDMLAGRYPSEDFAELRPRLTWDRATGMLVARRGSAMIAITSGGTIPDRGLYPVVLAGGDDSRRGRSNRVGELDEEMVFESRVGDAITLGSSTWRIEEITPQQVVVTPAPGMPGRLPFWKGDGPGRPFELGAAIGSFTRRTDTLRRRDRTGAQAKLVEAGLDEFAATELLNLLTEQHDVTGRVPDDKTLVIERFRDELGDWRIVLHSPFGSRVHAPWSLVIGARIREQYGLDASVSYSDDGIVLRMPPSGDEDEPSLAALDLLLDPAEVTTAVREQITGSAMFAARFREAAARALLLPRRKPGQRQPLWQQRHRAAQLLGVAAQFPDFPIVIEAVRECLQDDFDLPALTEMMTKIDSGHIRIVEVTTANPSPFARSMLLSYTAQFLYDNDAPLAERRAVALSLDPVLLAEILGGDDAPDLADLLDSDVVAEVSAEVARIAPSRQVTTTDGLWDLLRSHGPLTRDEILARVSDEIVEGTLDKGSVVDGWLTSESGRLVFAVTRPGASESRSGASESSVLWWAATDDAARLRDGLGVPPPAGIAQAYLEPVADPLGDLVRRYSRTHGPFTVMELADDLGLTGALAAELTRRLSNDRLLMAGPTRTFNDGSRLPTWIDPDLLRRIRRRTLAKLRGQVEAVSPEALTRFVPRWQHLADGGDLHGPDGVLQAIEQLSGARFPASALETFILPARVADYRPEYLDELSARGEILWCGHQALPGAKGDGIISLHLAETAALTLPWSDEVAQTRTPIEPAPAPVEPVETTVLETLQRGGQFFDSLLAVADTAAPTVAQTLWDLVWQSKITSDSFGALRELIGARGGAHRSARSAARPRPGRGLRGLRALAYGAGAANPLNAGVSTAGNTETTAVSSAGDGISENARATAMSSAASMRMAMSATEHSSTALRDILAARAGGRWSALPLPVQNSANQGSTSDAQQATVRAHADVTVLLQRYGVVTRTPGLAEQVATDAATMYRVLAEMEQSGQVQRGYFVEGLGGAQFALSGAVEELRRAATATPPTATTLSPPTATRSAAEISARTTTGPNRDVYVIAATDPANPFGILLPWPAVAHGSDEASATHRPGRRAGAVVVLVDGRAVLYLERGGRTLLALDIGDDSASDGPGSAARRAESQVPPTVPRSIVDIATGALVQAISRGDVSRATVRQINDVTALDAVAAARRATADDDSPAVVVTRSLIAAGATVHTQGLRIEGPRARR